MLFAIQVLIDPFWAVLVSSTHHYGAAAMHTIESLLNLGLSIWWVRSFGLSGVIAGTLVARIATTGWFIPAVAVRIVDIDLNRAARHIIVPTLLSAATCSSFLWLVPIAADGLAVPLLALSGALIFAVIFTIFAFSRKERQAAIQYICGPNWLAEAVR
jgi:O-antigen/teichoic acid export membrane protein